jgi:hypothetical protein
MQTLGCCGTGTFTDDMKLLQHSVVQEHDTCSEAIRSIAHAQPGSDWEAALTYVRELLVEPDHVAGA